VSFLHQSGAPGGWWPVIDEQPDALAIQQMNELACVVACAEMLLQSRGIKGIDQTEIFETAAMPTVIEYVAEALNTLAPRENFRWVAGTPKLPLTDEEIIRRLSTKVWSPTMQFGSGLGHNITIDGIDNRNLLFIRDPWEGTGYKMEIRDFIRYWGGRGIWEFRR